MDTSQWPQESCTRPTPETNTNNKKPVLVRPNNYKELQQQGALNCPRCDSTNTKFCYYNNYSLSQPRYLCKTCKRYWTEGGNLRNVPLGGASRKNKRPPSKKAVAPTNLSPPRITPQNPKMNDVQTLNLDFNPSEFGVLPFGLGFRNLNNPHENPSFCSSNNIGFGNTLPGPSSVFPSLCFSLDHHGYGNSLGGVHQGNPVPRLAGLPFDQDLIKPFPTTGTIDHQFDHHGKGQAGSNGYWHGMIDGGGSW